MSWKKNMTSKPLFQITFTLRRPRVAIFANIIKIVTSLIKKTLKAQKKLKQLEIIYQNPFYICIS